MSRRPDIHPPASLLPAEKAEEVRAELSRVLASLVFRNSRRCQSLLRRITELSLTGELDSLKERSLGVEVFGRPPDYDTAQDPVVRASAAEIRKKLAQYYVEAGQESETRIEVPPGSYHAEFHFIPAPKPVAVPPSKPRSRTMIVGVSIGVAATLAAIAFFATTSFSKRSALDELWDPVLKTPGSVLICLGIQAAYNLVSAQAQDAIQGVVKQQSTDPPKPIRDEDLVLLRDRYVALDDALCLVRITSLLDRYGKTFRVRAEPSTSFADLRETPAVLIGAFDNSWTLRTTGQLRFTFSKDSERDIGMVNDRQHPENTQWKLINYWPKWDVPIDYAIITRAIDTTSDRHVLIVAGLTQYGTLGAGEFVSNPDYFSAAARHLPANWQKKNLQIVLSVPVVNRISGRPQVLATHVW